jgi:vancomycin resistance protein YoaR
VPLPLDARRLLRIGIGAAVATVLLLASVLMLLTIAQAGRVLPGTQVAGVELGGRDEWSARRLLAPALEREQQRPVGVSAPGLRLQVRPVDAGVRFDIDATAAAALAHGRSGVTAPLVRLTAPVTRTDITPRAQLDEAMLVAWLDRTAALIERDASVGELAVDPSTRTVSVVGPRGGIVLDREASLERLSAALLDPSIARVELVTRTSPPLGSWSALEYLAERVRSALDGPITLEHEGRRLTIAPEVLAELIEVDSVSTAAGAAPRLTIPPDRLRLLLGEQARTTFNSGTATDARISTPDIPPVSLTELASATFEPVPADVEVIPGRSRATFVPRRTADQLVTMIMDGSRRAEADLIVVRPTLTTEAALEGRPTHLLGTFTTFHAAGGARTSNIRLLADLLDDILIAPGEEFSVNGTSGPRRCEDGFVPAGTIVRGELVDTCGGGVSQFGTTIMNAAFFAGLPLEQWQPHSFFISRYPAGREATLSYPDLDVRFVNDTEGWIVLRTSHTPDSITVALYGVPRWSTVSAELSDRRAPTTFDEVLRATTDLPPGTRRVVQSGGGGFTVTVTRAREQDGERTTERWTTVYRPQQRIVEVGVTPAPSVNPSVGPADAGPPVAAGATTGD